MSDDPLRRAILALLGPRPAPAQRLQFAQELEALAAEQRVLAEADQRSGTRVRALRGIAEHNAAQRAGGRGGRPKGSGARFLRWEPWRGHGIHRSGHLHVGRALWQELGEPERLDVQRVGGRLVLRACGALDGWAVVRTANAMPRLNIGDESADALGLVEGRSPAHVEAGAIVTD